MSDLRAALRETIKVRNDNIDRLSAAAEIDGIYAARRAAGIADNDAGMGRLAEAETRDWRARK